MATTVSLSGFRELEQELNNLSKAIGRAVLRRAGIKAMEPMAATARSLAPVLSGDLQSSITVGARAEMDDLGKVAYRLVKGGGGTDAQALSALREARRSNATQVSAVTLYMGPAKANNRDDAIKALAQEFGTSFHGPQPYMRPAFDAQAMPTIERLKVELRAEIDKAVARAARKAARAAARG